MSEWTHGYNAEQSYISQFYLQNTPQWLEFSAVIAGSSPPSLLAVGRRRRYLDLGCGTGFGLAMLAAMNPDIDFVGVDFMPNHVAQGMAWAQRAALPNLKFYEADFIAIQHHWPAELGQFDYVVGHGIISWVSATVQQAVVGCLSQALVPGGLVMLSYNCPSGWGDAVYFQHLARSAQTRLGHTSSVALSQTIESFNKLVVAKGLPTVIYPKTGPRMAGFSGKSRAYMEQEFLHDNWQPFWPSELDALVAPARLQRAGNAELKDLWLVGLLSQEARTVIEPYVGTPMEEDWVDYVTIKPFRRDVFQRGLVKLTPIQKMTLLLDTEVTATFKEMPDRWSFNLSIGEMNGAAERYKPVYEAVHQGKKTLRQLMSMPFARGWELSVILHVVTMAMAKGEFMLSNSATDAKVAAVRRLNQTIAVVACEGTSQDVLASGTLAGSVSAPGHCLMLLDALSRGVLPEPIALAHALLERLLALNKDIREVPFPFQKTTPNDRAVEVAKHFVEQVLPEWRRMRVFG